MIRKMYPLLSGGIDSTVATLKRMQQPDFIELQPVFIDYGQKACEQEWNSVRNISGELPRLAENRPIHFENPRRIDLSSTPDRTERAFGWSKSQLIEGNIGNEPYLENRNMVLLSLASSYVESQIKESEEGIIVTGFRDEFSDTKKEFVNLLNDLLVFLLKGTKKSIIVEAPAVGYGPWGKKRMLEDFRHFKEIIDLTWSCYEPNEGKPCLHCDACRDRKQAFHEVFGTGHRQ